MARATITEISQLAVETTRGTAVTVAANFRRLQSMSVSLSPTVEVSAFRPQGYKTATVSALNKEWSSGSISGQPTYNEIIYPLSSVMTAGTVTAGSGADIGSHLWQFIPSSTALDAPKTFTIQSGTAAGQSHQVTYGLLNSFNMTYNNGRDSIELGGDLMARELTTTGFTFSTAATSPALVPILPSQTSFYLDPSAATLGATKLTGVVGGSFSISDRWGPHWVYDSALNSWKEHVETEPGIEVSLLVEADTAGMSRLTELRDSTTKFLRISSIGATIAGTAKYACHFNVALKWTDMGEFEDQDGVYAVQFTGRAVHDATWGFAYSADVTNTISAAAF